MMKWHAVAVMILCTVLAAGSVAHARGLGRNLKRVGQRAASAVGSGGTSTVSQDDAAIRNAYGRSISNRNYAIYLLGEAINLKGMKQYKSSIAGSFARSSFDADNLIAMNAVGVELSDKVREALREIETLDEHQKEKFSEAMGYFALSNRDENEKSELLKQFIAKAVGGTVIHQARSGGDVGQAIGAGVTAAQLRTTYRRLAADMDSSKIKVQSLIAEVNRVSANNNITAKAVDRIPDNPVFDDDDEDEDEAEEVRPAVGKSSTAVVVPGLSTAEQASMEASAKQLDHADSSTVVTAAPPSTTAGRDIPPADIDSVDGTGTAQDKPVVSAPGQGQGSGAGAEGKGGEYETGYRQGADDANAGRKYRADAFKSVDYLKGYEAGYKETKGRE